MVIERAERSMVKGMGKERSKEEEEKVFCGKTKVFSISLSLLLGSLTAIKLFCKMHKDFVKWKNMENFYISMKSNAI